MVRDCLLEIDYHLRAEKRREFTQSASSLIQCEGEGHVRTVVYEDRDEPDHILWVEEWTGRDVLERYLSTDAFLALLGGLRALGTVLDCRVIELSAATHATSGTLPRRLEGWHATHLQPTNKEKQS